MFHTETEGRPRRVGKGGPCARGGEEARNALFDVTATSIDSEAYNEQIENKNMRCKLQQDMTTRAPIPAVEALRARLQALDGGARRRRAVLPFGVPPIDEWLPDGGLALGALHEVAGGGNGAVDGAAAALFAAGIAARTRGRVLWCVTRHDLFAPAIAQAGLKPDRVIYVEGGDEKTVLACCEEGLREHSGLGAVIGEVMRLSMTASRRLQLAAEGSGAIGIAIRRLPAFHRTRGRSIGSGLGAAARDSLPPCGGGMGWGVVQYGTAVPHRTTPTPIPSPQGGGEEFATLANRIL
jgi:protein ImuA